MGKTKVENTSTVTPTESEEKLNQLQLEQQQAIQPSAIGLQQKAYDLGQLLLTGQGLPGYLSGLPQGATTQPMSYQPDIPVSSGAIGEDYTSEIVKRSLRDIFPQFQAMGLPIESGVAQSIAGRTAGDIRTQVAESDLDRQFAIEQYNREMRSGTEEFNINNQQTTQYQNLNNLLNLLNLAVGGQAQIQQPVISTGATLGQRLAGLRTNTSSGTTKYDFFTSPFTSSVLSAAGTAAGGWMGG